MLANETLAERNVRLFDSPTPVAFVTGSAAPRVGRCIAEHLLAQNFQLVFHSHEASRPAQDFVEQLSKQGRTAMLVHGEVQDQEQVDAWVAQVLDRFQRVDVVVNSAAIWDPKPLEDTRAEDYQRFFQVNALGTALCSQKFGLAMTRQPSGGAIINIGDWAIGRPYRGFAAYFLSKAGVDAWTRTLAVELGQRNPRVRVNAVLPGPIQLSEGISPARREKIVQDCLLKREGSADDLAQAVVFFATSPFITGACLPVDGGRTIWAGDSSDSVAHPHWAAD